MSTKTTFKRIALVTVAALGLSLVAVAPSQAAYNALACTVAGSGAGTSSVACSQNSGVNNYVVLSANNSKDLYITIAGGSMVGGGSVKVVTAGGSVAIATPTVGTITVTGYTFTAGAQATTATDTVVITVTDAAAVALAAARAAGTYFERSTAFIGAGSSPVSSDTANLVAPKAASSTPVANIEVIQYSTATGVSPAVMMQNASAKLVTVSVAGGAGYVSTASNGTLAGPSASATGAADSDFYIYSNGNAGVASITVSVNGSVVATKSVTFYGTVASLTVAPAQSLFWNGYSTPNATVITAKDSLGNVVPNVDIYTVSDATTVIADKNYVGYTDSKGVLSATIASLAVGTASLAFANGTDSTAAGYVATSATAVRVSDGSGDISVVVSFDKDTYLPGEVATVTYTVSNAAGPVPAWSSASGYVNDTTSSLALTTNNLPSYYLNIKGDKGQASYKVNMPLSAGTVELSTTPYSDSVKVTNASATVALDTTAADAAAEATDAANAATDAANAAAEAADAATAAAQDAADAVAALSAQVADLIAGLKAQLTALTNLVIKIQKKVKA